MIELKDVSKTFTLHNQGSAVIEVISDVSFRVAPGECVALTGASGAGKSTLMRMIYGNYLTQAGSIRIGDVDIVRAEPREVIALRREVLGYVSQFLRVVPRVPTLDVVADPLRALGVPAAEARDRAETLLAQLNIPRPRRSRAVSSSASTSRAGLPMPTPRCSWTSRPQASMRPTARSCFP